MNSIKMKQKPTKTKKIVNQVSLFLKYNSINFLFISYFLNLKANHQASIWDWHPKYLGKACKGRETEKWVLSGRQTQKYWLAKYTTSWSLTTMKILKMKRGLLLLILYLIKTWWECALCQGLCLPLEPAACSTEPRNSQVMQFSLHPLTLTANRKSTDLKYSTFLFIFHRDLGGKKINLLLILKRQKESHKILNSWFLLESLQIWSQGPVPLQK